MTTYRKSRRRLHRLTRTRHRLDHQTPVTPDDPLAATQAAYAHNVFVLTALRRLERIHLNSLEDADLARAWAAETHCPRCDEDDDMEGDHIRHHLRQRLQKHGEPVTVPTPGAPFRSGLRFAARLLGLSKPEAAILQLLVALNHGARLSDVCDALGDLSVAGAVTVIAAATGLPAPKVAEALQPEGRLVSSGLVTVESDRCQLQRKVYLQPRLMDLLSIPGLDRERFVRAFLEPAPASTLSLEDYADPAPIRLALELVAAALKAGARGVNVLLSGPTGVGKSELARLFGQALGVQVFAVGRADERGDSATPMERLTSLRLAHQIAPRGEAVLLFDELEDLFRWELDLFSASRAAPQMSKQWFGALLEENPLPTVWCTNRVDGIDPAFLRRFTFAIELKAPGARQRADVLQHHAGGDLPRADCEAIAQRYETSPAQLGTAVRGARLVAPQGKLDRATIEAVLAPVHKLITGSDAALRPVFEPGGYRLDALHCAEDLEALAAQLATFKDGPTAGVSLCLYGPPGVGKSEFVKFLAWKTRRPLVYRRVSDLVSPYVGMTERNIAAAFDEARADGSLLLFDEADSFLRERRGAQRSWEVTQVNEFLQQLEVFPGLVACTTNLWRDLDEAALRRFVFKLEFRYPTTTQVLGLFRSFFPAALEAAGEAVVTAGLRSLDRLTPGDFAAVARRVHALRSEPTAAALLALLAGEVGVKADAPRAVGFGR